MASFNVNLGNFLTECRNNALDEIKTHPLYSDWKVKQSNLRSRLVELAGAELLDEYMEAVGATHGIELNTVMLCGAACHSEIGKRFDSSLIENKDFIKEFVG